MTTKKKRQRERATRHPPTTHHMRTTRNYLEAQSHSYLNQLTEPTTRPDKTSTTWTTKGDQQPAAEGGSTLMTQYDSSVKNGAASSSPPFTRPAGPTSEKPREMNGGRRRRSFTSPSSLDNDD